MQERTRIRPFERSEKSNPSAPTLNADVQQEIVELFARLLEEIILTQTSQEDENEN